MAFTIRSVNSRAWTRAAPGSDAGGGGTSGAPMRTWTRPRLGQLRPIGCTVSVPIIRLAHPRPANARTLPGADVPARRGSAVAARPAPRRRPGRWCAASGGSCSAPRTELVCRQVRHRVGCFPHGRVLVRLWWCGARAVGGRRWRVVGAGGPAGVRGCCARSPPSAVLPQGAGRGRDEQQAERHCDGRASRTVRPSSAVAPAAAAAPTARVAAAAAARPGARVPPPPDAPGSQGLDLPADGQQVQHHQPEQQPGYGLQRDQQPESTQQARDAAPQHSVAAHAAPGLVSSVRPGGGRPGSPSWERSCRPWRGPW